MVTSMTCIVSELSILSIPCKHFLGSMIKTNSKRMDNLRLKKDNILWKLMDWRFRITKRNLSNKKNNID